jgi:hypothetical protein
MSQCCGNIVGMQFIAHFSPWRSERRPCWHCVHFDGMSGQARPSARQAGLQGSGPWQQMVAAYGSASLDQMTSRGLRAFDPQEGGLRQSRQLADDPGHAEQKTCPMRSG